MTDCITRLRCTGCGSEASIDEPLPFRCPNAKARDDVDHVLRRELSGERDDGGLPWRDAFLDEAPDPFLRYRRLLHSHNVAIARGMPDEEYVGLVEKLNAAIESIVGRRFRETPFSSYEELNIAIGRSSGKLFVKDETGNVSGSHKARHLAGVMLWLEVARRTSLVGDLRERRLAIASCGNAALAAAVVAKAADAPLDVYIPTDARASVVEQLTELGAHLTVCERNPGVKGDPCIHGFHEALKHGALPFTVQGNENGLALEGGLTLGWEIASAVLRGPTPLDRIFIQVGGGALASSCGQALREAVELGVLPRMPKVHAVQTKGGYPLRRAWELIVRELLDGVAPLEPETDHELASRLAEPEMKDDRESILKYAAAHRSEFMWPWESPPRSAAYGILDDETYDWLGVIDLMLETGGYPVVATEDEILKANEVAKEETGISVEHTGTAGLAGLMRVQRAGVLGESESIAVLFTGVER